MFKWTKIENNTSVTWKLFRLESFVFQFAVQKYEAKDIQSSNFVCCFVWV